MNQSTKADKQGLASVVGWAGGLLIGALRLIPHPWNLASIGSLGLFGGAKLRLWQACALPLGVLAASDLLLWWIHGGNPLYAPWHLTRFYVYPIFLVYVLLGRALLHKGSLKWLAAASLIGSVQFFLLTNFFYWLLQPLEPVGTMLEAFRYSRDLQGLLTCYINALPFQSDGTIVPFALAAMIGDLFFSVTLFAVHARVTGLASEGQPAKVEVEMNQF